MADEIDDPLKKDDDSIAEDPVKAVDCEKGFWVALGASLIGLISKRFVLAILILVSFMLMGFEIILYVPDGRVQVAMTIFAYVAGFASAAVTFYLGNHNQAVQQSLQAQASQIKAAQK